ncbi:hypothetical protein [Herpetosiphon sp. NSE202]|uniref:hypothetical protein n=1 Tax=Herpetosiphon sp. NSE202 TaxID=3351349 RepID=UPI003630FD4A
MRLFVRFVAVGLMAIALVGCMAGAPSVSSSPVPSLSSTSGKSEIARPANRVFVNIIFESSQLPMTTPQPFRLHFSSTFPRTMAATVTVSLTTTGVLTVDAPLILHTIVPGIQTMEIPAMFHSTQEGFGQIIAFVTVDPLLTATDTPPCPIHYEYAVSKGFLASKIGIFTSTDDYLVAAVEHQIITPDERDEIRRQWQTVSDTKDVVIMGVDGPLEEPTYIDVPNLPIPDC